MEKYRYTSHPLTRSTDGYLAGVCEGLGRHLGVDALWVRLAWIAAVVFFGTGILLYLLMWWVVPREDAQPSEPVVWKRNGSGSYTPPLQRTSVDRKLLGVCGGVARRWNLDPSLVRLGVVGLATLSFGIVALVYLLAAIVIPGPSQPLRTQAHPVDL